MESLNVNVENNRYYYELDLAKIFATFLIVLQHTISPEWSTLAVNSASWMVLNFLFELSRLGVPLFFMCSGIGMLQKERSFNSILKKNISHLLLVYVMWMQVYGIRDIVSMLIKGEGNIRVYINAYVKSVLFGQYHVWFLFTLIGLYLLVPLLYPIVQRKELQIYMVVLSVIATVILPYLARVPGYSRMEYTLGSFDLNNLYGYLMYFVLGYCVLTCVSKKGKSMAILAVTGVVGLLFGYVLSAVQSFREGIAVQTPYDCFHIFGFIMCLGFFAIFLLVPLNNKHLRTIVLGVKDCGLGIYLIHPILLPLVQNVHGIYRALCAIGIYLILLFVCWVLSLNKITKRLLL